MGAESPNLYIANLPKEQQESKDFVRCICLDNNQKRGRAELLQKNWKTILYLLDEAQFVDADTPPKLDLLQAQAPEEVIKSIIRPEIEEGQVLHVSVVYTKLQIILIKSVSDLKRNGIMWAPIRLMKKR